VTPSTLEKPFEILLIEDNAGDVILIREVLKKITPATLTAVCDSEDAMELLRQRTTTAGASLPNLILLDLHLPRMDGHGMLAELRKDPALRFVPVVVFSSSDTEREITKSYELGASCYVAKPFDLASFNEVVDSIVHFWLKTVRLPKHRSMGEPI